MSRRPQQPGLRHVEPHLDGVAALLLARAFSTDPFMSWLVPDGRSRARRLRHLFGWEVSQARAKGEALLTEDGSGCALWFAPGHWKTTGWAQVTGAVAAMRAVAPTRWSRALRSFDRIEAVHPEEPHWYLATIGTDPDRRGTGAGGALIEAGLQRADSEGVGAYLESSNEINIGYYERFGFEVSEEIALARGPRLWAMWRPCSDS